MDYAYEALGPGKFLQFGHALARAAFPDTPLLPLGPESSERPAPASGFMLVRAIYVAHPQAPDARSRLALTLERDLPEVRRRIEQGARSFLLLTNVQGATSMRSTAGDRVRKLLAPLPVPVECWWRDTLDARLEAAFELKLAYPELLPPAAGDPMQRRISALRRLVEVEFEAQRRLPLAPPDTADDLLNLFIDPQAVLAAGDPWTVEPSQLRLAAKALLDPAFSRTAPFVLLEGGPGQGKSTLLRFVCQVHRMQLLGHDTPADYRPTRSRLPISVQLPQLAAWLARPLRPGQHASLESYVAAQIARAAGSSFEPSDLLAIIPECPLLLAFDGLDEVADPTVRQGLLVEIKAALDRMAARGVCIQALITTRPACYARSALPVAPTLRLQPLDAGQVEQLITTRVAAGRCSPAGGARLRSVLASQPSTAELARNPLEADLLCHLVHQQAPEIPSRRSQLYGAYVESCLRRAIPAGTDQPVSLDLHGLMAQHGLLAWQLQADSECDSAAATVVPEQSQADAIEQASILVANGGGRFRFAARSLREYLAARYLFDALPPDDKPDEAERFSLLAQNPYWLNVSRFYAGLVHRAYLPHLSTTLAAAAQDDAHKGSSYPYLLSLQLLADQVFTPQPKVQQSAMALCIAGLRARRWHAGEWLDGGSRLPQACGGRDLARAAMALLGELPPADEAAALSRLVQTHALPAELAHWWRSRLWSAVGLELDRWLEEGRRLDLLSGLTPDELERLTTSVAPSRRQRVALLLGGDEQPEWSALEADARLSAGDCSWWEKQLGQRPGDVDFLALFAARAEVSAITALWPQYQERVDALADEERHRIREAIRRCRERGPGEAVRCPVPLPDSPSPTAVSLLCGRMPPEQMIDFYRSHLSADQGLDPTVAELCATAALHLVLTEDPAWSEQLATLRRIYARGITPEIGPRPALPLAQPIAEAVLAEPGVYPLVLVCLANDAERARFDGKTTPVATTVRTQGWFVQNKEYLN